MIWNVGLAAVASVFLLAGILAALGLRSGRSGATGPLQGFLLAGHSLGRAPVVSLLVSSSFGLNALFYQVWLGYSVGAWGLVAQGAWALSFVLLARGTTVIEKQSTLHGLLGTRFGKATRVLAGLCSVVGMMYLLGWEAGIGKATFAGMLAFGGELQDPQLTLAASWLSASVVFGCLLYTILGGLRGNANADLLFNITKTIAVVAVTAALLVKATDADQPSFSALLFPSVETMRREIGYWGLLTNIAFSLAWQFVDPSTWQSIIAGRRDGGQVATNLRSSGLAVFVAPGIIGTLLGVALHSVTGVTADNVLAKVVEGVSTTSPVVLFIAFATLVACVMSLIDGLLLATAFTVVADILHPSQELLSLDQNPGRAERMVAAVRVALIAVALCAAWGVDTLLGMLGGTLFDFLYVVIITQLSLVGPVLVCLFTHRDVRWPAAIPILASLVIGFGSVYLGTALDMKALVDGAGTFTIVASFLLTLVVTQPASTVSTQAVAHGR